jgi:iron complex outermembrane receptor protein
MNSILNYSQLLILACLIVVAAPILADEARTDVDQTGADEAVVTGDSHNTEENPDSKPSTGQDDIFPLPEIAVTAKKIDAPPTIIVRKVSLEDISARNAHTAGDALTYVSGVNVQIGGSSADSRAWIRGFRDRDVLVLFDGIPIASGFEGTIDLNEIAMENVAGIKVMKSAPSVIYGTKLGTDDRRLLRASGGGGNGNISYSLSAQHQQADDFSLSDDYDPELNQPAGRRINSDFERNSLFFQLDAEQTPFGHASMFINLSDAEKGLPPETGVDDPDYERLTNSQRQTLGLSNQFNNIPLSLKLFYNSYESELTAFTDESYSEVDEIEQAEDYSYGGKLYSTIETSSNNSLILTAGAQSDVFKAEGELEDGNKAELTTYTLAVEDQFWINDKLSLAAGGIYTYFDQTRLGKSTSAFNPQLAIAWKTTPALSFHASAAQRTRFPKLRELYRRRYGNPDLKPQTANNYEAGFSYQHGSGFASDFSLFRSDIDDLIERPDRRAIYQNLDRVTIKGLELATGGWVTGNLFARLAYTYVDAAEELPDGSSRQLRSRPKNTAIAEFRYRLPHEVLFSFNGIFVSGLYDLDPVGVYTRISSYFVANIKASMPFATHYEAYVAVSNLGDTDYVQRLGSPREGRAFVFGMNLRF